MPVTFKKASKKPAIHLEVDEWPDPPLRREDQPLAVDRRTNFNPLIRIQCLECIGIDEIVPNERNARKHPDHQLSRLAASIEEFGFLVPVVLDERNRILSGYGRYLAARRIGLTELPAVRAKHLTAAQKRAFTIADNQLAELSGWDTPILAEELSYLFGKDVEALQDPSIIGFEEVEVDQILLGEERAEKRDPADQNIPPLEEAAVTARGDLWICGKHKLCCADATTPDAYCAVMRRDLANIVFIDPPFSVLNTGYVTDREGGRELADAHGEISRSRFTGLLSAALTCVRESMTVGAVAYVCTDWQHLLELFTAAEPLFGEMKNLIVWAKKDAGMGSFYRSQHEMICVYATPGKIANNFGLGKGRHRTNVWTYPGLNGFGRDETLAMHPSVKPVAMVVDALRDCSKRGDTVLDAFGGSGTTMIAAEKTGRQARLIEIDPLQCDVIVKRWQEFAGKAARLAETDETFDEVKARRGVGRNQQGDEK